MLGGERAGTPSAQPRTATQRFHYLRTSITFPSGALPPAALLHLPLVLFVTVLSLFVRPMPSCNNGYHLLSVGCASCQQALVSAGFFAAGGALIHLGGMERLQSPPHDCGHGSVGARKTDWKLKLFSFLKLP